MCSETQSTKVCTICGVEKPRTDEHFYSKRITGRNYVYTNPRCKPCDRQYVREHKLLKKYGLTIKEVEDLLVKQQHRCHICERKFDPTVKGKRMFNVPYVDHDHRTGKVRGILCGNCNTGLGHFKDSPRLLQRAIDYLCEDIV